MKFSKKKGMLKKVSVMLLAVLLVAVQHISVFANGGAVVVNDSSFDPTIEFSTEDIEWDINTRQGYDNAYTSAVSPDPSHIILNGNTATFYGYERPAHFDYMYYEETDSSEKTFEFTIEQKYTDYHTLYSFGFLINCSDNGNGLTSGYILSLEQTAIVLRKFTDLDLKALSQDLSGGHTFMNSATAVAHKSIPTGTESGSESKHEFVLKSSYDAFTVERNGEVLFDFDLQTIESGKKPVNYTGGNNFGLYAAYAQHYCEELSYAVMSDIVLNTKTTMPESNINVNFIDKATSKPVQGAYSESGYIGQGYTVYPPDRIGNYIYVGTADSLTGKYINSVSTVDLQYVAPSYTVRYVDEQGKVLGEETIEGLNLETYTLEAKSFDGYILKSEKTKTVTLTADNPYVMAEFVYKAEATAVGSPKTGDSGNAIWLAVAGIAVLSALAFRLKRKKDR